MLQQQYANESLTRLGRHYLSRSRHDQPPYECLFCPRKEDIVCFTMRCLGSMLYMSRKTKLKKGVSILSILRWRKNNVFFCTRIKDYKRLRIFPHWDLFIFSLRFKGDKKKYLSRSTVSEGGKTKHELSRDFVKLSRTGKQQIFTFFHDHISWFKTMHLTFRAKYPVNKMPFFCTSSDNLWTFCNAPGGEM